VTETRALAGIPVAVLAGGLGTRLRPAIGERQKAVAEVAGRPFLTRLLDQIARFGFRDVVLCTGYGAEHSSRPWRLQLPEVARSDRYALYRIEAAPSAADSK